MTDCEIPTRQGWKRGRAAQFLGARDSERNRFQVSCGISAFQSGEARSRKSAEGSAPFQFRPVCEERFDRHWGTEWRVRGGVVGFRFALPNLPGWGWTTCSWTADFGVH